MYIKHPLSSKQTSIIVIRTILIYFLIFSLRGKAYNAEGRLLKCLPYRPGNLKNMSLGSRRLIGLMKKKIEHMFIKVFNLLLGWYLISPHFFSLFTKMQMQKNRCKKSHQLHFLRYYYHFLYIPSQLPDQTQHGENSGGKYPKSSSPGWKKSKTYYPSGLLTKNL